MNSGPSIFSTIHMVIPLEASSLQGFMNSWVIFQLFLWEKYLFVFNSIFCFFLPACLLAADVMSSKLQRCWIRILSLMKHVLSDVGRMYSNGGLIC